MKLDDLTLGEIKQLKSLFQGNESSCCIEDLGTQIVILQRGWIFVGTLTKKGSSMRLNNAATIRVWGTSKGLGEIAESGPTSNTKLDTVPEVSFHELTVIGSIKCNEAKWEKYLK
jgi:hypothetical protein